jgi:hypothetical protein
MSKTKTNQPSATNTNVAPTEALASTPNMNTIIATKPVKTVPKMERVSKTAAATLLLEHGAKFFNATILVANKSRAKNAPALVERNITCRMGVKKYTTAELAKAAGKTPKNVNTPDTNPKTVKDLTKLGMVTVYEMTGVGRIKEKAYRTIKLDQIVSMKIAGRNVVTPLYKAPKKEKMPVLIPALPL